MARYRTIAVDSLMSPKPAAFLSNDLAGRNELRRKGFVSDNECGVDLSDSDSESVLASQQASLHIPLVDRFGSQVNRNSSRTDGVLQALQAVAQLGDDAGQFQQQLSGAQF